MNSKLSLQPPVNSLRCYNGTRGNCANENIDTFPVGDTTCDELQLQCYCMTRFFRNGTIDFKELAIDNFKHNLTRNCRLGNFLGERDCFCNWDKCNENGWNPMPSDITTTRGPSAPTSASTTVLTTTQSYTTPKPTTTAGNEAPNIKAIEKCLLQITLFIVFLVKYL